MSIARTGTQRRSVKRHVYATLTAPQRSINRGLMAVCYTPRMSSVNDEANNSNRTVLRETNVAASRVTPGATPGTPWRLTRLSRRRYFLPVPPDRSAGDGRPGYKLIENLTRAEPGSDIRAVMVDRVVSVSPLSLDLTSRIDFETVERPLPAGGLAELFAAGSHALGAHAVPSRPCGGNGRSALVVPTLGAKPGVRR